MQCTTPPDDATPVVRNRMEEAHTSLVADCNTYAAAKHGFVKLIQDIVNELWYKYLKTLNTFYTHVTGHDLLRHLETNCGELHQK